VGADLCRYESKMARGKQLPHVNMTKAINLMFQAGR